MNSMKRQKDGTLKDELPRLVDAQYATGDQWRNNSRKNEDGLGMLVAQGVIGVKYWTGIEPNPSIMRRALEEIFGDA